MEMKNLGRAGRRGMLILVALVIGAVLMGLSLSASASGNTAPAGNAHVLRYVATVNRVKILRPGNVGGGGIARYRLTTADTGALVGTVYESCTGVWDERSMCTWGFAFNDFESSQITSVGLFSLVDDVHVVPVTGGSGTYRGVTGEASWQFFGTNNNKAHVTIDLTRVTP